MSEQVKKIQIRSEVIQDVLGYIPNWTIRWGSVVLCSIVLICTLIAFIIRYPDIISGPAKITTKSAPIQVINEGSGKIQHILVADTANVAVGDSILIIESSIGIESIEALKASLVKVKPVLALKQEDMRFPEVVALSNLGEIQNDYNLLTAHIADYNNQLNDKGHRQKVKSIKKQIANHKHLNNIISNQIGIMQSKLSDETEKYTIQKGLYDEAVISKMDFMKSKGTLDDKKLETESVRRYVVENNIRITEYENQLHILKFEFEEKLRKKREMISQSVKLMDNYINNWSFKHIVTAPITGQLNYRKDLTPGAYVKAGEPLITVVPANQEYISTITVNSNGFGKVKPGQKVRIKLDNYPHYEFGELLGNVVSTTLIPLENKAYDYSQNQIANQYQYTVKVKLANGMRTTYHKRIALTPEMNGTAEIVTKDMRLVERIVNKAKL